MKIGKMTNLVLALALVTSANAAIYTEKDYVAECDKLAESATSGVDCAEGLRDLSVEAQSNSVKFDDFEKAGDECSRKCLSSVAKKNDKRVIAQQAKMPKVTKDMTEATFNEITKIHESNPSVASGLLLSDAMAMMSAQEGKKQGIILHDTLPQEKLIHIKNYLKKNVCDKNAMLIFSDLTDKGVVDMLTGQKMPFQASKKCMDIHLDTMK